MPLVPLRGSHACKRQKAKVLIGKALMIFALVGYFRARCTRDIENAAQN